MNILKKVKLPSIELKNLLFILLFTFILYFFEFYYFLNDSGDFRCLEIINYIIFNFEIKVPIHCDVQFYIKASNDFEYFFSTENPYQKRPIFVFALYIFQNLVRTFSFDLLDNMLIFLASAYLVQISILFLISKQITKFLNLDVNKNIKYLYFILFFLIPNIRWNIFFPSHGSLTLFGLLYTLNLINKKYKKNQIYQLIAVFGIFSLAHRIFIIYVLIFLFFYIYKNKSCNLVNVVQGFLIILPSQIYNYSISKLGLVSFDYNAVAYKQFYWIFDKFQKLQTFNDGEFCQEFSTFYKCNFLVTLDLLKYYWYQILLLVFLGMLKRNFFKKSNFINLMLVVLVVYLFWSFIGWYLPFRFINYSLGYFIFIALSMLIRNNFKYDYLLILVLIVSLLDTIYLDVYNSPEYVVLTFPKLASLLILFVVMEIELKVVRTFLIRN